MLVRASLFSQRSPSLFVATLVLTFAVALAALLALSGCPAQEPRDEPPEGVVIEREAPPNDVPPSNNDELDNDERDEPEVAPPPAPRPVEPPAELTPRAIRLRVRPDVVDAGWRPVRRLAPTTDAVRTSLANPAYVAGLFAHAALSEDAALLYGVLHPNAAVPMPPTLSRKARGAPEEEADPEAEAKWRKLWWRLRTQLYGAQAVHLWGGARPGSDGAATLAVVLAPRQPDAEPLRTVLLLAPHPKGRIRHDPGAAENRATVGDGNEREINPPVRWAVVDVQTHVAADARSLASPVAARFPLDQPQPQLFPVEAAPEMAELQPTKPEHAARLDAQLRETLQLLTAAKPVTPPPFAKTVATALGLGAPPDAHDEAAAILGRIPEGAARLATRIEASLVDAPHLRNVRLLRLYRTWHEDSPGLVAEGAAVLEGALGFPRLYKLYWWSPVGNERKAEPLIPGVRGNPAGNNLTVQGPTWRLLAWEPWLTESDPEELNR